MTAEEKNFQRVIGNKLTALREEAGLTQEELAEKIGVESNSVHRYENAERKINFMTAVKAASALNAGVEELIPDEYIQGDPKTPLEREAEKVFHQLPPSEQAMILRQMKGLLIVSA